MTSFDEPVEGVPEFLIGGGEMGALMRAKDWSSTALGPIDRWPEALRANVGLMINSLQPMFVAWGPELTFLYNDSYAPFFGSTRPNVLGTPFREAWSDIWSDIAPMVDRTLNGESIWLDDLHLVMERDGQSVDTWYSFSYSPVHDESGAIAGMFCACSETTKRVLADAELRSSEARLRFLDDLHVATTRESDADAVLITTTRMVGDFLKASNCAYADMDQDSEGFTIRGDWFAPGSSTIVGHYQLRDFGATSASTLSAGQPLIIEDVEASLAPDGAASFAALGISATICVPLIKDGKLRALMAVHNKAPREWTADEITVVRDVTERSWAHVERVGVEAALRDRETSLRALNTDLEREVLKRSNEREMLWRLSEDMLARADYGGAMSAVNPAWTKVLGWSEQALMTTPYATIMHPDDVAVTMAALEKMSETKRPTDFENRIRTEQGDYKNIGWTVSPEPDGMNFIAIGRDLTEMRTRERELAQVQEDLRQSQKMEAVGQLTGGIAHDFNNLLQGISGSLEMIERFIPLGREDKVKAYMEAAKTSSLRAAALTQRLLAFARRQTLDPKATDVNRLVSGVEELIRRSVGPQVELKFECAEQLWLTRIDPSQLENALLNLSINARDAMPSGGQISIATCNVTLGDTQAADRDLSPGDYILIEVSDTGVGMSEDTKSRAFDPFFTTKPMGQGTGLGLSMVYGFVRQSGGQLRVMSAEGEGTTMLLWLPRFVGAVAADPVRDPGEALVTGDGETILVIDDEPAVRMLMVEELRAHGHRIVEADDGVSGLAILDSDTEIDLLVTDVGLPGGINGRQVADAARRRRPDLKVLFVTGYAEKAAVGDGLLDPGMAVLTKPFAMDVLSRKVRDLLDR